MPPNWTHPKCLSMMKRQTVVQQKTIGASNSTAETQGQLAECKNFYDILEKAEL